MVVRDVTDTTDSITREGDTISTVTVPYKLSTIKPP